MMESDASIDVERVEQLAALLDEHALTRLEIECEDFKIVLEKNTPYGVSAAPAATTPAPLTAAEAVCQQDAVAPVDAVPHKPVSLVKPSAPTTAGNKPASAPQVRSASNAETVVSAPILGMVYRGKEPGANPYIHIGDAVEAGNVLCLIEVMKMLSEVKSPISGVVSAIHFEDGTMVEHGAPLVSLV
ncbi:MAG: hypothetical protein LBD25_05015 [Coriobacteriales bacterium]|jgi:biotin carboxyl carrier protein|nr:hypothetical protein [Coriobacteriales bacterium]